MSAQELPRNLDAERSVLGAILVHNDAFNLAAERITAADFFRDAHARIFRRMIDLSERNVAIDFTTLKDELARHQELDEVGGPAYVASLADGVPRATNVEYYARIVKEKSTLRSLIYAANKIRESAYRGEDEVGAIVDQAEQLVFGVADDRAHGGFEMMDRIVSGHFGQIEAAFQHRRLVTGVPTGFIELDAMTRGFQKGNLLIVAARPSMGKTSLVLNIAEYVAQRPELGLVGFFSLEMSKAELFLRQLCSVAQIDSTRLMSGRLRTEEFGRISQALEALAAMQLAIDDTGAMGVLEMRAKARRLKAERGLALVIVDYIQLMSSNRRYENRTLELGAISRSLKALAKELDVPVVVLSQLSRGPESRSDHRPMLSDLRDSGALEQDADVVLFIYRDEVYRTDSPDRGVAEVIVAKQRNGPTGTCRLAFLREQTRFANLQTVA